MMEKYNESYQKGYKATVLEIYEKLLKHGYPEEEPESCRALRKKML